MSNRNASACIAVIAISYAILTGHASAQSKVKLSSLFPNLGPVGSVVILRGKGFTDTSNIVHFGPGGQASQSSTKGGTEISYTIPGAVGPCDLRTCMIRSIRVMAGQYLIYVSNAQGRSNTLTFEVTE